MTGASAAQRAIRAAAAASRRVISLQELHGAGDRRRREAAPRCRGRVTATEPRTLAPPGRRIAEVTAVRAVGAYHLISRARRGGPRDPRPGPVLHAGRRRAVGRGRGRAALPAARVLVRARARRPTGRAELPARGDRARAPSGWRELDAGRGARRCVGPARASASTRRARARGRCSWAAASASRRCCAWQDELGAERPRRCSASAPPPTPQAAGAVRRASRRSPPTTARWAARRSSRSCCASELDADPEATVFACGPPPMLEAVRACAPSAAVPAQLALESGMACGYGACFGCVVPDARRLRAPLRRRAGARRRDARVRAVPRVSAGTDRPLRRRAPRPGPQRLRHLRRDRRPPRLRRRPARALPLRRLRVEDDHARAARRATRRRGCGRPRRADQLDRAAEQGPRRLPRRTTCPSSPSCPCRCASR